MNALSLTAPSLLDWLAPQSAAIGQAIRRAASPGYESWWQRCASVGFCANPIQASAVDPDTGRRVMTMIRCGNRRTAICPSCSELYAADTWQLIHAGTTGGHHGMPDTIAERPQVFATLTAPSFGPVHTSQRPGQKKRACHPAAKRQVCRHGNPLSCHTVHAPGDTAIGQPLCGDCYDYTGHVLFNWYAPELWRRFTIALRRTITRQLRRIGVDPDRVRISFVKVAEYQRRAIIHYHTLIRLDPTDRNSHTRSAESDQVLSSAELAALVHTAADQVRLPVENPTAKSAGESEVRQLRFGTQIDTQPLTTPDDTGSPASLARRVAAYLAKYVTKSVADFGIAARRISPHAIADLDITAHTRRILTTLTRLAALPGNAAMLAWLHTLGYRGHITSKSRRYSTTMGALRAARHHWRQHQAELPAPAGAHQGPAVQPGRSPAGKHLADWRIEDCGHRNDGERLLVHTAARQARQHRYIARWEACGPTGASP